MASVFLFATPIGRSIVFVDQFGPRLPYLFLLHAVFDEEECQMHGSNLVPVVGGRDEISWTVVGEEEIHGKFIGKLGSVFLFPLAGMQILKFSREQTDVDFLSLFNNVGHTYLNTTDVTSFVA